jgi:hypothetical protein
MRVVIAVVLTTLLVGVSTAAAHPHHKAPFKCPPENKGVIVADAQAVVYNAGTVLYEEGRPEEGPREIFGCAYGSRRSYHFGPTSYGSATSGSGGTSPIKLAGPIVAYAVDQSNILGEHEIHEIWVRNLRTGKLIHRMPNGSPTKSGNIGLGDTAAIVVKSDGSVGWIVTTSDGPQVRSVDKTGSHLLDASPEIDLSSLALAGSWLYWTQGGKPMSAMLD